MVNRVKSSGQMTLEAGGSVDMVYLDFSKAFDKVGHGILHHKLKALGITGHLRIYIFLISLQDDQIL